MKQWNGCLKNTVFEWLTSLLPQNMALLKTVIKYMKVVESDLKYELYWRKCEENEVFLSNNFHSLKS